MEYFIAALLISGFIALTLISRTDRKIPLARAYNKTLSDNQTEETGKRWIGREHV